MHCVTLTRYHYYSTDIKQTNSKLLKIQSQVLQKQRRYDTVVAFGKLCSNDEVSVPNILLEYTDNVSEVIDYQSLFTEIHTILHEVGGINPGNCKSRALAMGEFRIGDGDPANAFVQLSLCFVAGRSAEVKQAIGEQSLACLKRFYAISMEKLDLQITVELIDIRREDYFKYPEGTLTPQ